MIIKSVKEWHEAYEAGLIPKNIPKYPDKAYKNKGWPGWGPFLGTNNIANHLREFLPFENAREFVRSLKFKNTDEWKEYSKSGERPNNIPSAPDYTYKNEGWVNWNNFLGVVKKERFMPFEKARAFVHTLKLKGQKEWREYAKSGKRPDDIPADPYHSYSEEWINTGDWLGTGRIADKYKQFLSFEEAKEYARSLNLKSGKKWFKYWSDHNKPDNIPYSPHKIYKNEGWIDWSYFLGVE